MSLHTRFRLAAAGVLCLAQWLPAQEPSRLGIAAPAVQPSANQQLADTVADHLRQSRLLHDYQVNIEVRDGTADLIGTMADAHQRDEALRLAQGVPGVDKVRDRLVVKGEITQAQNVEPKFPPPPTELKGAEPVVPPGVHDLHAGRLQDPVPIFQAPPPGFYDLNPPKMPPYAWPTYAPYNNFSRVGYPELNPYQSWPFIGPNYPFPKIPPGWRKVSLEWQDGHWWYGTHSNSHDWWHLRYW